MSRVIMNLTPRSMHVHIFQRGIARLLLAALVGSSIFSPAVVLRAEDVEGGSIDAPVHEQPVEDGETSASNESESEKETEVLESAAADEADAAPVLEGSPEESDAEESEVAEAESAVATSTGDIEAGGENVGASELGVSEGSAEASPTAASTSAAAAAPDTSATTTDTGGGILSLSGSSTPPAIGATEVVASSTASSTGPTIVSGKAIALANILNLVNANFVNSKGIILFSNFFEVIKNSIDFRTYYNSASSTCGGPCTGGDDVTIRMENNAHIDNDIFIKASSGGNVATSTGSTAIHTGDAYAGLNLINIANTNFVDSEYLLVTLNAFNDVEGDLVFPSLSNFFASMAKGVSSLSSLSIDNHASVENNLAINADSGGNSTAAAEDAQIATGDAYASTNVFNQINTTLAGDRTISILFRVHGSWAGDVFGAPSDLLWMQTLDEKIFLLERSESSGSAGGAVGVMASSTAFISNDVSVVALTGDNRIDTTDTALISTGDAYAGANIVNIANGNVVGRNWILAIVNIFGNFTGNIAFGRPDLWVGEQIETPSKIDNGSELTYKFTVINNGDSDASNVVLSDAYDTDHLEIFEASVPYMEHEGVLLWDLPALRAGDGMEITYHARIKDASNGTEIANTVTVESRETDNNVEDNTDTASVITDSPTIHRSLKERKRMLNTAGVSPDTLSVARTAGTGYVMPGELIQQEVIVRNTTRKASLPVILHDTLYGPSGEVIKDEPWNLGVILPHEEVTIAYDIVFDGDAAPGLYTLSTVIDAGEKEAVFDRNGLIFLAIASETEPVIATISSVAAAVTEEEDPEEGLLDLFAPQTAHAAAENLEAGAGHAEATLLETSALLLLGLLFGLPYMAPALYSRVREKVVGRK